MNNSKVAVYTTLAVGIIAIAMFVGFWYIVAHFIIKFW